MLVIVIMHEAQLTGLDLNLLVVLDVLLEEQNVTRAAKRLGLTQSATSRALGRLRDQFDDPLLVRTHSGMLPTLRAMELREGLRDALQSLVALTRAAARFDAAVLSRTFRVATADYCVAVVIPPLLGMIQAVAPLVRVEVAAPGERIDEQLEAGDIDVFIGPRRASFKGVVWKPLLKDEFVTLVRRDHPNVGRTLTRAQFASLGHIVVTPERNATPSAIDRELEKHGSSRHVALRVPSFLVAPLVVSQSDLICTIPRRLAQRFDATLPLRLHKTPLELGPLNLSIAWHERFQGDEAHQWFRKLVADAAGEHR